MNRQYALYNVKCTRIMILHTVNICVKDHGKVKNLPSTTLNKIMNQHIIKLKFVI